MKFQSILSLMLIILLMLYCDKSTTPIVEITGITHTNEEGDIVGDIDPADWCDLCYPRLRIYPFNNMIKINTFRLSFSADVIDTFYTESITFKNLSADIKRLSFSNVNNFFSIDKTSLILVKNGLDSISVSFVVSDTTILSYRDTLTITDDKNLTETVLLSGRWTRMGNDPNVENDLYSVSESDCVSFGPAYPNPSNTITTIRYELPQDYYVLLEIVDSDYNKIRTLVDQQQPSGIHSIRWSFDGIKAGIYRAILNIEGAETYGDILVDYEYD